MIVALAGGVGGSKLVLGLSRLLAADELAVIGNTGDDFRLLGLHVCPDLDTLTYTLAGKADPARGWGLAADSFHCLEALSKLGAPDWFQLGDRDLATHLWRTNLLREGYSLSEVTERLCRAFQVPCRLLPMTNAYTPTHLLTDRGELHLQEYLVKEGCQPTIERVKYVDIEEAKPVPGCRNLLSGARGIFLCPSNPFISIGPILAVPGIRELLARSPAPVVAVSPIVRGQALKGPAARMLKQLGYPVSPRAVAELYRDFLDILVLDRRDGDLKAEIEKLGIRAVIADTLMTTLDKKTALAAKLLDLL